MPRLERHADLAVGLEAADARAMPGARVDDDERPPRRIKLDGRRRDHFHEAVVDRTIKRPAVDEELDLIVEHVRSGLGQVLAVLVAALAHHVPEQNATLRGIHHVLHRRGEHSERRKRAGRREVCLIIWHLVTPARSIHHGLLYRPRHGVIRLAHRVLPSYRVGCSPPWEARFSPTSKSLPTSPGIPEILRPP